MRYLLTLCCLLLPALSWAANCYIDAQPGADCAGNYSIANRNCTGTDGISFQAPQACIDQATPGDTIFMRAGTYTHAPAGANAIFLRFTTPGTAGNLITLRGYQDEWPTIRGQGFDDSDRGDGFAGGPLGNTGEQLIGIETNYIRLHKIRVTNSNRWGIRINQGDNNEIEDVYVFSNWQYNVHVEGNSNLIRYLESNWGRHQSGIFFTEDPGTSNDNIVEYSLFWENGRHEDGTKVLPAENIDPAGGGNSDAIQFLHGCHVNVTSETNLCLRNILRYNVGFRNADDGIDISAANTLVLGNVMLDSGPEGNKNYKVLRDVRDENQFVLNVGYLTTSGTARGYEIRQDSGSSTPTQLTHNLALGNVSNGFTPTVPSLTSWLSNLAATSTGEDFNIVGGCAATAGCTTNWGEDGANGVTYSGDPQLTNPTLWQSGGRLVVTIPPSEDTIQKRVQWMLDQVQTAFTPAIGSGLINAGTGTSVTWTNPQTSQQESRPCVGTCDVGPYEYGMAPLTRTFPAAEGYGASTQGPRAGNGSYVVRHVTTLNYSGPGSIQAALETDPGGAGVFVVFEVAGYINVPGPAVALMNLQAAYPNFYIAGHTAPGGGVCLRLDPAATEETVLLAIQASQMIVRGLCFRHGIDPGGVNSAPNIAVSPGVSNVLVDRITSDFSVAEHFDASANVNGDVSNVTVQRSAFINSLEPNSNGVLINDDEAQPQTIIGLSFLRNFIAHGRARNPRVTSRNSAGVELINTAIYGTEESGGSVLNSQTDILGTYARESAGLPNFDWEGDPGYGGRPWYNDKSGAAGDPSTYMDGNIVEYRSGGIVNDNGGTFAVVRDLATVGQAIPAGWQRSTRLATPAAFPATITDAATAWDTIVVQQNVGAVWRLTETGTLVRRPVDTGLEKALIDARDKRPQTTLGRTTYISDPADVGGFPTIATGTPYADVDRDGQADVWETANGLNPADPADAFLTTLQPPYLNIEVFLFGLEVNGTDGATLRYGARISNGAILR